MLIKSITNTIKIGFLANILPGSQFEGHNSIGRFTTFKGSIGKYSYVGSNGVILCKIGRYTSIASGVHVINGRHPIKEPYVSTSPIFYSPNSILGAGFTNKYVFEEYRYADNDHAVVIGNDCWIGANVSIIDGVTISDGVVVLAGAVVTKDMPPYAIVAGVPAKVIGYRYTTYQIDKLMEIKWWNKDESWIQQHASEFLNIDQFIERNI